MQTAAEFFIHHPAASAAAAFVIAFLDRRRLFDVFRDGREARAERQPACLLSSAAR